MMSEQEESLTDEKGSKKGRRVSFSAFEIDDSETRKRELAAQEQFASEHYPNEPFFFTWKDFVARNFFISGPWSLDYYHTARGSENFHIYLWIAKDMAWAENWYWPAMIFGSAALAWCFVLLSHAIQARNILEVYMWVATVLWLAGNFVWMAGEVFNGDDDFVVPRTAHIMETAIGWILLYHLILKPLKIIGQPDDFDTSIYARPELKCRFSYFQKWREYEHSHTLCWLGKDLSWNRLSPVPWIICLIPTLVIAADFIFVTFRTKHQMEDCVHYLAQLMWVIANMLWALGNMFIASDGDDNPTYVFNTGSRAQSSMRHAAAWMLFAAFWPIIILYLVWIPLTILKKFPNDGRGSLNRLVRDKGSHSDV